MHPALDLEQARFNMVEQQIRPWDVLDQSVLDLLSTVKREQFVPPPLRALAFTDMEIPLRLTDADGATVDTGQSMWSPKMEARVLQELGVRSHESVLEIGTGSGYLTALLAHKAHHVLSVELDPRLHAFGAANLARAGVRNVKCVEGDGARGWAAGAPYDVIVVTGALPVLPASLRDQLRPGGRLAAVVGQPPVMGAELITRGADGGFDTLRLFETLLAPLTNAVRPSAFRF